MMNVHPLCYVDMTEEELNQFMNITRTHPFTGKTTSIDLPITEAQWRAYEDGALVQNAFPNLDADQREFIISDIPPGEWDNYIPGDDE